MPMDLYAHVKPGDRLPAFRVTTIDGEVFDSENPTGTNRWIYFFILSCPHCREGLKFLNAAFEKIPVLPFRFLAIGRDHKTEDLRVFRDKKQYQLPLAPDPGRNIYGMFATGKVPRSIVASPGGIVLAHSRGFQIKEYENLMRMAGLPRP